MSPWLKERVTGNLNRYGNPIKIWNNGSLVARMRRDLGRKEGKWVGAVMDERKLMKKGDDSEGRIVFISQNKGNSQLMIIFLMQERPLELSK